jgi:Trk-type K+ transport system membrane component
MIELQTYIILLLIIAAVGMGYIFRVLWQQIRLFRKKINDVELRHFRYILFAISLVIIIMGLIPITINLINLFVETNRPQTVSSTSLVYSLSVHIQSLLLSYLLWRIYRNAGDDDS